MTVLGLWALEDGGRCELCPDSGGGHPPSWRGWPAIIRSAARAPLGFIVSAASRALQFRWENLTVSSGPVREIPPSA